MAVQAGYQALETFNEKMRQKSWDILQKCAKQMRRCILVLARPYHMNPGIGHEIEVSLQSHGYPILWAQYFPMDEDLMSWFFGEEIHVQSFAITYLL